MYSMRHALYRRMKPDFKLYLITDRHASTLPLPQAIRLALEGGVRAIQLREKDLPVRELLALAGELRVVTREYGAKLLINDRVDVAVAMDADGVHLGTQSMPCPVVRKIIGRNRMIGVSTHSLDEAKNAEDEGADFITFGPVYSTPSKARFGPPVGLEELKKAKKEIEIPVFGLGGIKSGNIDAVLQAKADGVAVISAILAAPDIQGAAEEIIGYIGR